jgi:hypothetical protein
MQKPRPLLPYAADLTLLQVATTTLMTRFCGQGCPGIASAVVNHLETLLRHPDIQASLIASEGYGSLLTQWRTVLDMTREAAAKQQLMNAQPVHPSSAALLH